MRDVRVLWTHNFDPHIEAAGTFFKSTVDSVRARGVDLHLEYLGNLRSMRQLLQAQRRVKKLATNYDLVHAQYGSACALVTSVVKNVPKIVTIRGSDWNVHSSSVGFIYVHTRIASLLTRYALPQFDAVIAVSNRVASSLRRFTRDTAVTVLPSPVDLSRFMPHNKDEAKKLLGFPECDEKWVLFSSVRLENPVKRFDLARTAFERAAAQHGNLRLRVATKLSRDAMPLFVAACDLILCTSENEGWPNSIKEALACNVPFVATDVSDLNDIAESEPSCRICAPDPDLLAENMCDVLSGEQPLNLRERVLGMGLEASSDRLLDMYRTVLSST